MSQSYPDHLDVSCLARSERFISTDLELDAVMNLLLYETRKKGLNTRRSLSTILSEIIPWSES